MADVFISYSRKDIEFASQLHAAFEARGRTVWRDLKDIPPTADFQKEIYSGIEGAHAFVFIISPDSVVSKACALEIEHAVLYNKRLVPIVRRETPSGDVPEPLRRLNWIYFREADDFSAAFESLFKAIDTDLDWVHAHTRLLTRAIEWENKGRDASFVLRGKDLQAAEQWLAQAGPAKEPRPTPLQTQYILASRQEANKRQRLILAGVSVALAVSIVLGLLALISRNEAVNQSKIARSRELSVTANSFLEVDPELSLLLAMEAVNTTDTPQAEAALTQALLGSHLRAVLEDHPVPTYEVHFSPDGQFVLIRNLEAVWVRETNQWRPVANLNPNQTGGITSASWSPDGHLIVTTGRDKTARIWKANSWQLLGELGDHTYEVLRATFSPDSQWLVTAEGCEDSRIECNASVRVWHLEPNSTGNGMTANMITLLPGYMHEVSGAMFSPDGKYLLTTGGCNPNRCNTTASVWDTRTWHRVAELGDYQFTLSEAAFSPNGKLVVTVGGCNLRGCDNRVQIWDTRTWQSLTELHGNTENVSLPMFSPDSSLLFTGTSKGNAQLWQVASGQSVAVLTGHISSITGAAFSPDGRFVVTTSRDHSARVWETSTGQNVEILIGHTAEVWSALFSPDGQTIVTAGDDGVRMWESSIGTIQAELRGHSSGVIFAAFSQEGKRVVTVGGCFLNEVCDGSARVWDAQTGTSLAELRLKTGTISGAALSPDGQLVATGGDTGAVQLWDAATGQPRLELRGHIDYVRSPAFSPDGRTLLTASNDGTARLWDIRTGQTLAVLKGHTDRVLFAAFSPDGKYIVTTSRDGTARLWDANSGASLRVLEGHLTAVWSAAFSPDSKFVVTASWDGSARVWRVDNGQLVAEMLGHVDRLWDASFSPDGHLAVTASADRTARVWDAATGRSLFELRGHTGAVNTALFSRDGKFIVTASADGTARLWDVATGRTLLVLRGQKGPVSSAVFSPDGHSILTANGDGTALIYACSICGSVQDLLSVARTRVTRQLTCQERNQYLHDNLTCPTPSPTPTLEGTPECIIKVRFIACSTPTPTAAPKPSS